MTTPLKDLIFELSDTGQPKICIAVCDSKEERKRLTQETLANLDKENVTASLFLFEPSLVDVVAKLQDYLRGRKIDVAIFDGLENLEEKSSELVLAKLNFRRDILASLNVSILLWVTNGLLKQLIARAPDFWSRRTATYFFNRVDVREYLKKVFGQERVADYRAFANRKVSRALKTLLSNEAQLNELITVSKCASPIQIDKHIRAIGVVVESLVHDSKEGEEALITMSLWNLGDVDKLIRNLWESRKSARGYFGDFYTDVFLEVSQRLVKILMNYKRNLLKKANEHQKTALATDFAQAALNAASIVLRKSASQEYRKRRRSSFEFSTTEEDTNRNAVIISDESLSPEAGIAYQALEELASWLNGEDMQLPGIFSDLEGRLLRMLCNETKNVATVAKKMKISKAQARKEIEALKDKVSAFLGAA